MAKQSLKQIVDAAEQKKTWENHSTMNHYIASLYLSIDYPRDSFCRLDVTGQHLPMLHLLCAEDQSITEVFVENGSSLLFYLRNRKVLF